jgi:hypothetical protein
MSEVKKPLKKPQKPEPVIDINEQVPEEGQMLLGFPWILRIAGLKHEIKLTGMKLPTFTTGMISRGDATIEFANSAEMALNAYFRLWMTSPTSRDITINAFDFTGNPIETWKMQAIPVAMGFSEFSVTSDEPWVTQVAFTVSEISVEAVNKI